MKRKYVILRENYRQLIVSFKEKKYKHYFRYYDSSGVYFIPRGSKIEYVNEKDGRYHGFFVRFGKLYKRLIDERRVMKNILVPIDVNNEFYDTYDEARLKLELEDSDTKISEDEVCECSAG